MSNQGRHGEAVFAARCLADDAKIKAIVNHPADDQHGWDFIVDISPKNNPKIPQDLQTHLIQCFTQIKTTRLKKPVTKLKLSNAIKAAKSPLPHFVFLLHYDGKDPQPKFYSRHIWEQEISEWLKKARGAQQKKSLHSISVSLSFSETDCLQENPVDWMFGVIQKNGLENYFTSKKAIVDSVGYSGFPQEGRIDFGTLKSIDDIVLHEIGILEDLPVKRFEIFDNRFGIKSSEPVTRIDAGRVTFNRPGKPLTFQMISIDGDVFEIPSLAWAPSLVSVEDPQFRTRVKAGNIDLITSANASLRNISVTVNVGTPLPFLEQIGLLCFIDWTEKGKLTFNVFSENGRMFSGTVNEKFGAEPWMPRLEVIGHHLLTIFTREKIRNISISFSELSKSCNSLYVIASILSAGTVKFESDFEKHVEPFDRLAGYSYGQLGDWSFGAIYELDLVHRENNDLFQTFYFNEPRTLRSFSFKQSLSEAKNMAQELFMDYRNSSTKKIAFFNDGDLIKWSEGLGGNGSMEISIE